MTIENVNILNFNVIKNQISFFQIMQNNLAF